MLVEFSVGNYRSFQAPVTLSMVAANISSRSGLLDTHNAFTANSRLELLTSAAIYGANASGKSNCIQALNFMRRFVLTSSRETQITETIPVEPFRLNTATENQPSFFEIVFLVDNTQYRYGFQVQRQRVVEEWLYRLGKAREMKLFDRTDDQIKINPRNFPEGRGLEDRTRPNALFLSVVAQFNGETAINVLQWFQQLIMNTGIDNDRDLFLATASFENSDYRRDIEQFIKRLDIGIEDFEIEDVPLTMPPNIPPEIAELIARIQKNTGISGRSIKTIHRRFNSEGQVQDTVAFDLQEHESAGTQRLFVLAPALLHALHHGAVLAIDELDARIHPNLVTELIRLFHSHTTNPWHAQLLFTTHNTNLLSARLFRRDQVWFVEKSRQGASDLYSLAEYRLDDRKMVRNDASFEKDYVLGRYGAIPFIGNLDELLRVNDEQTAQNGE